MTGEMRASDPSVLIVDDEKEVADAYALRLEGVADVTVAYSGDQALETLAAEPDPDVVLIDRHMPGTSGDEVLAELREMGVRTRAVMVTAIDPNLDILELPFDDYLSKPVERADLRAAVDQQCQVLAYELLGEYFQLESKRAVVEAEVSAERLQDNDDFAELETRTTALADRIRSLLPEADRLLETFSGIDREGY